MNVERLHEAFHTFAEASRTLEASYGLLQEQLDRLTAELESKNRRVRELELYHERNKRLIAMGEMAAKIVHEIRNPLCSIELFATMLEKDLAEPVHRDLARGISTGIGSLNTILTNMLMFARPHSPSLRDARLDRVLEESLAAIRPLTESRRVAVVPDLAECRIRGDEELLKQVFMNIIMNAVQAADGGGAVAVKLRRENGSAVVEVRDSGAGIAPDHLERIFDPFFTTKENGTGLGLAIASSIVRAHGGSITAESEPGKGSVFRIVFPCETGLKEV